MGNIQANVFSRLSDNFLQNIDKFLSQFLILQMNPQHTVPTLDDNGAYIWDSHAIAVYLLEKYAENSPLYTKDPYIRARINQRLHFDSGVLFAKLYALVHPIYFGAKEMKQEHIDAVFQAYEMLNTFLKDDSYLVGDHLTIADISCVTTTSSLNQMVPIDPVKYPNIIAWIDRISQLPYYEELNAKPVQEYGDMVRGLLQKHQSE